jgi:hypothetical protein
MPSVVCHHHHPHPCQRRRNPTNNGITAASPPFSSPLVTPPPPRRRHALSAFSIIHGAILDRHAASTSSGTTRRVPLPPAPPLSKDGPIAPAPPSRLPRCIGLLSGGRRLTLLCFSGCCRRSGDSNGSTLTLTLVPASGATTMKLSFYSPGLDGGGISHGPVAEYRVMAVCCGCLLFLLVVVCCGVVRETYVWYATNITNTGAKSCTNRFGCQIAIHTMTAICTRSI